MYATIDSYDQLYQPQKERFSVPNVEIKELTPQSITAAYTNPTLVLFYAPWCVHCTQFMPIYQNIANQLEQNGITLTCGMINCDTYKAVPDAFALRGFPTLILFVKGKQLTYKGQRTVSDLMTWLKENTM